MPKRPPSTEEILNEVQEICAQNNLRFTAVRREVLQMLLQAHVPCKAYDLLPRLVANNTQPTAVYRALDFLLQHGFAHKIHSQNSYLACHHPWHRHDCHFIICRQCGDTRECCDSATTRAISETARKNKFRKPQAVVEIFAVCQKCASH